MYSVSCHICITALNRIPSCFLFFYFLFRFSYLENVGEFCKAQWVNLSTLENSAIQKLSTTTTTTAAAAAATTIITTTTTTSITTSRILEVTLCPQWHPEHLQDVYIT